MTGLSNPEFYIIRNMAEETRHRPRLTPKGERTRARIVAAAAALIYERGVAGTTLDDVRAAAEVSGSQLSHYFAGKDELVQAVIGHQADIIAGNQEQADLGTTEGIKAWRDMVLALAASAVAAALHYVDLDQLGAYAPANRTGDRPVSFNARRIAALADNPKENLEP
jgi:AcrR family transcriptional regulator